MKEGFLSMERRKFLGFVTTAAAGALLEARGSLLAEQPLCLLLDPGNRCCLAEARAGYEAALRTSDVQLFAGRGSAQPATVIVPGCLEVRPEIARLMAGWLEAGSRVVFESAAGFGGTGVLRSHHELLEALGGVRIGEPVDLWASRNPGQAVPYISYSWPVEAMIRDFSRVIPVRASRPLGVETIGVAEGRTVAARWRYRKGEMVFLSSALGPVLLSGDRQAGLWLRSLLDQPRPS